MVTSIDFSCLIIPKWGYDLGNHNLGQMITYQYNFTRVYQGLQGLQGLVGSTPINVHVCFHPHPQLRDVPCLGVAALILIPDPADPEDPGRPY
jgi:hypothetical protein